MAERRLKVHLLIKDQDVRQDFTRVISSIGGFDIHPYDKGISADLLILQLSEKPEEGIQLAYEALTSGLVRNVFLTSAMIKHELLIEAMRAGVKEFLPLPLKPEDLKRALIRITEQSVQEAAEVEPLKKRGMIINVMGSKGGVGTTTVTVNLATSLAGLDREKTVALIDMNLLFGEIPMFLGMDTMFDWVEVAKNIYRLDNTYLLSVMALDGSGVRVLPSPARVLDEVAVTPMVVETLLSHMQSMFDYIVIDNGQSLDEISKVVIRLSDRQIIVTLLSLPCLINVKRLQNAFRDFQYPLDESIQILVNRHQKHSIISVADAEKSLSKKISWTIPNDFQTTMNAINQGKPLGLVEPQSEITASFKQLASGIAGRTVKKRGLLSWR